jgi:acyl-CoA synthetase (AMP-forming)/AMP-acid ligase II
VYSVDELMHQRKSSGAKALVACTPLLETAFAVSRRVGILDENVFLFDIPRAESSSKFAHASVEDLINEGFKLADLDQLEWTKGQGARQTAFLCFSSGTSGLPVRAFPLQPQLQLTPSESCYDIALQRDLECVTARHI